MGNGASPMLRAALDMVAADHARAETGRGYARRAHVVATEALEALEQARASLKSDSVPSLAVVVRFFALRRATSLSLHSLSAGSEFWAKQLSKAVA